MSLIIKNIVGVLLGLAFVWIGTRHFATPAIFNAIVPDYLGWPAFWNYSSGALEIILGLGLIVPYTRPNAAILLFVLVILMSLANLNMWVNDVPFNGTRLTTRGHIIRWIIQFILLGVLLWLGDLSNKSNETAPVINSHNGAE